MHNKSRFVSRTFVLLGDIIFLNLGFILAFYVRYAKLPEANFPAYLRIAPWVTICFILLLKIYDLYAKRIKPKDEMLFSLNISLFLTLMFTIILSFMLRAFEFPRTVVFISFVFQFILLSLWRMYIANWDRKLFGAKDLIIIGESREVESFLRKLQSDSDNIYKPVAILLSEGTFEAQDIIVGHEREANEIIQKLKPNVLLLCPSLTRERKKEIVSFALAHNIEVMLVPDLYDIMLAQVQLEAVDDTMVFSLGGFAIPSHEAFLKRTMDVLLSAFALAVTSLLMTVISLLIKFDSQGPIFFVQERMGEGGKTFKLYKFRTMITDAEKLTGPVLAEENDIRVTKLGRFLRQTRIDEIPQFINVLKGDMSIVGPRPERPFFVDRFTSEIPEYAYRLHVKAGITGLAQVEGKYDTTPEDKLRYDLLYAKRYSPFLDMRIVLHTLKVLFMKGKAH